MNETNPTSVLQDLFRAAVKAASAENCLPRYLTNVKHRNVVVAGAGKAAAEMARTVENYVEGSVSGIVITRYGHSASCSQIEVVEASHPIPDHAGIDATSRILKLLDHQSSDSLVLSLFSGGASALMSLPLPAITFEQKRSITRELLLSGASIQEINCVRKHLSAVKGGRLARRIHPARSLTLCISDVVGDDPSAIGSGPTVPDPTSCDDVLKVLSDYKITVPPNIYTKLRSGELETPKPEDPVFQRTEVHVVATAIDSLKAAAKAAEKFGFEAIIMTDSLTGDSNEAAKNHAIEIKKLVAEKSISVPTVLLTGGETTVTVRGKGKGGPNTQFLLALALELNHTVPAYAIACDTDGIDGTEDNAGAMITPSTLRRAREKDLNAETYLKNNDSHGFFDQLGDLIEIGPTRTNVNDFRAVLIYPR